jgi:hypothetical protein
VTEPNLAPEVVPTRLAELRVEGSLDPGAGVAFFLTLSRRPGMPDEVLARLLEEAAARLRAGDLIVDPFCRGCGRDHSDQTSGTDGGGR